MNLEHIILFLGIWLLCSSIPCAGLPEWHTATRWNQQKKFSFKKPGSVSLTSEGDVATLSNEDGHEVKRSLIQGDAKTSVSNSSGGTNAKFEIISGADACEVVGDCIMSKDTTANWKYSNDESCTIKVLSKGMLMSDKFMTEQGYDELTIRSDSNVVGTFSGSGNGYGPNQLSVSPDDVIEWITDYSGTKDGWKICMSDAVPDACVGCKVGKCLWKNDKWWCNVCEADLVTTEDGRCIEGYLQLGGEFSIVKKEGWDAWMDGKEWKNQDRYKHRPELLHSEKCGASGVCNACEDADGCWHGVVGKPNYRFGDLKVNMPSNLPEQMSYTTTVWADCGSKGENWTVNVTEIDNGEVEVAVHPKGAQHWTIIEKVTTTKSVEFAPSGKVQVRLRMTPQLAGQLADARVNFYVNQGMPPFTDVCMGINMCLRNLFEKGKAWTPSDGFRLHNNNPKQKACLTNSSTFDGSVQMRALCNEFEECVRDRGNKENLLLVLEVIANTTPSAEGVESVATKQSLTNATSCFQPAAMDAEALECNCLGEMKAECEASEDIVECLRCKVCARHDICENWRNSTCPEQQKCDKYSMAAELTEESRSILLKRKDKPSSEWEESRLEPSITGKCTS
jgi:hypothetical protein